jgi:hypothetical protein
MPDANNCTMFTDKRPTCVTVIGWAWIVIGSLMCISSIMGLLASSLQIPEMHGTEQKDQFLVSMFSWFPILAIVQIGVAILGIISGFNFLKLKSWSRLFLEILTWFLLIFILGFGIFWVIAWVIVTKLDSSSTFTIMGTLMGTIITIIYVIPLGFMLKYLRGKKTRSVMKL